MKKLLLTTSLINMSCSSGWSVGGWEMTPADTTQPSVFIEIMDTDSVIHYYHDNLYETSNWCWIHHQFEDLKKVDE